MRADLRLRLREIAKTVSTAKMGVTGVAGVTGRGSHTPLHPRGTPFRREKNQSNQRVTPVTPCSTSKNGGGVRRYTEEGVAGGVAEGVTGAGVDSEDWLAHYEERAAIREYEGGYDRAEAEHLALEETITTLGPRPGPLH